MNDLECPYCHAEMEVERSDGEGTDEDKTYEKECPECGKIFTFTVDIIFSYSAEKAPCKNDESPHDWQPIKGFPEEYFKGHERCSVCQDERVVPQS